MKNGKIIVTGGAGFIGSHLTDKLIELGHEVIVIDDLSTGKKENVNPKANLLELDISSERILAALRNEFNDVGKFVKEVDYIFHLAARPRVPYSLEHPTETHRINITGTFNMLKFAKEKKVKKFIFASSSSVYGGNSIPFHEKMRLQPISPYAFQKEVGEGYCRIFDLCFGVPSVVFRFFNVYGRRTDSDSPYSLVIGKFLKQKKEGKPLTIFGTGNQTRDFTYVDDVTDACVLAMGEVTGIFNLCNGEKTTLNELAGLIGGKDYPLEYLPARKGDLLNSLGNNLRAKYELNWQPKIRIKEGIKLCQK